MASFADRAAQFGVNGTEKARGQTRDEKSPERTTLDLYRVNFEVTNLKPFPTWLLPHSNSEDSIKQLSSDGELTISG